jgi:hypothetical protein
VSAAESLRRRLSEVPTGQSGWRQFEDICVETLTFLFVPPLAKPIIQPRTYSGSERRDAVFPNRNRRIDGHWGDLLIELDARMILFEFKNYDTSEISKDEVLQTRSYLTRPMGRLAIVVGSKVPDKAAHIKRNTIFSNDQVVILFLTAEHLKEMLYRKERGEDPADVIMDEIELFYLQHE